MFSPDPTFSIPDLGLTRTRIADPDPQNRIYVFLTEKNDFKFSKIRSGIFIPDLDFSNPGVIKHRISDPGLKKASDPGSATLLILC
jgi:hypothetical protein